VQPSNRIAKLPPEWLEEQFITRTAGADELREVMNVLIAGYHQYRWAIPWSAVAIHLADLLELRRSVQGAEFLVTERKGQLLGAALCLPMASKQDWPRRWFSVRALAVIPEARRIGVARSLLAACARRGRQDRAAALCLHIASFMKAADHLARDLGFHRLGAGDFKLGTDQGLPGDQPVTMKAYAMPLD
jgi:ribosomal protein S18 acetylase RimI-like enzyme